MDGTLIDSIGVWNQVDCALMAAMGGPAEEEMAVGRRRDDFLAAHGTDDNPYLSYCLFLARHCGCSWSGEEVLRKRYEISRNFLIHQVDYKKGAPEVIQKLKSLGKTLVIATTTKRANMDIYRSLNENIRAKAPLDACFTAIYTREDVSSIKPSPEVHEKLMADLGKTREDCFILRIPWRECRRPKQRAFRQAPLRPVFRKDRKPSGSFPLPGMTAGMRCWKR